MARPISTLERPIGTDDRVCFVHVPKTAGTTLIQVIEQHFDEGEIARWLYPVTVIEATPEFFRTHRYFHGHVDYRLLRSRLAGPPVALTVLREPIDRFLSQYGNHRRVSKEQVPDVPADQLDAFQRITLDEFLLDPPPLVAPLAANFQDLHAKLLVTEPEPHRWPELLPLLATGRYVYPAPALESAKQALADFAFVGLTERFQESLFLLAYTFGWLPWIEYRSLNVGAERPRSEALPRHLLDRLVELNRIDLELYDHGRRLFETRYERMSQELLEGYGRAEHARLRLPLPPDVVLDLLERHHERRFVERHPAVPALALGFDAKISGRGWQTRERDAEHGVFRWSGPGRRASLDLPISPAADAWLKVSVAMHMTDEILESLRITVNEQPVGVDKHRSADGTLVEGLVPRAALARRPGCARIALEVTHTVMPRTVIPGSVDDRPLGVAVNRVDLRSIAEATVEPVADSPDMTWLRIERGPLRGLEVLARHPLDRRSRAVRDGEFEPFVEDALARLPALAGATIWDIGAHQGYHTLAFAARVGPRGRVVAYEPNPHNLTCLRQNLERAADLAARVTVVDHALSDRDGEADFLQGPDAGWHSAGGHLTDAIVPEEPAAYEDFTRATVRTARGDTLVAEARVPPPAFVKIDVEGAEHLVLRGLSRVLRRFGPTLLVEVHTITLMFQVLELLGAHGYRVSMLAPEHASRSRCHVSASPRPSLRGTLAAWWPRALRGRPAR